MIIPYGGSENEVVRLLLSKEEIDVDIKNNDNKTISDLLYIYHSEELVSEEKSSIYHITLAGKEQD